MIKAVFFDVGETLISDTRDWEVWADRLGIPRLTFFTMLGSMIERKIEHREIFRMFGVEAEAAKLQAERTTAGWEYGFEEGDLYPDARPCLQALRDAGYFVGIAGNQPPQALAALRALDLPADFITTSAELGTAKPDPAFFERLIAIAPNCRAAETMYVGDRFDKDVEPARGAGMHAVHIRRGPWGWIQTRDAATQADLEITGLAELSNALIRIAGRA